jgi:hypothetical protein
MPVRKTPIAAAGVAALALVLTGSPACSEDRPGRFSMNPADGGFVRLDRETGDMAFCKRGADGSWACDAMPDSQLAMRREMDKLRQENETLRRSGEHDRSASRDVPRYAPQEAPPAPGGDGQIPMPTEEDVDKLFDYVEGMAKKLKERLKRLEEQQGTDGKGTPL